MHVQDTLGGIGIVYHRVLVYGSEDTSTWNGIAIRIGASTKASESDSLLLFFSTKGSESQGARTQATTKESFTQQKVSEQPEATQEKPCEGINRKPGCRSVNPNKSVATGSKAVAQQGH